MKKYWSILLCVSVFVLMTGCGREQSATYELVQDEEGLFMMTDVQTLNAKGDQVYEILETTTLVFSEAEDAVLQLVIDYYDDTVATMQENAPEGVEISSSYADKVYVLNMHLYLDGADLQEIINGGYLMGVDEEELGEIDRISFKNTCAGLEAAGYILQEESEE